MKIIKLLLSICVLLIFGNKSFPQNINGNEKLILNLGIKIYPNPGKGFIEISSTQNIQNVDLKIYDILGKGILMLHNQTLPTKVDTKEFISGIYFIKFSTDKEEVQVVKFIKD